MYIKFVSGLVFGTLENYISYQALIQDIFLTERKQRTLFYVQGLRFGNILIFIPICITDAIGSENYSMGGGEVYL